MKKDTLAEVIIVPDAAAAGALVASRIAALIVANPATVLGVATGSTPGTVYAELARRVQRESLDVSRVRAFALDEYVGLDAAKPESYHSVIRREVTEQIGLDPANVRVPDGSIERIMTAGTEYDAGIVAAGGIDLQLLGIGRTGHIGFNEPGSSLASRTRIKTLAPLTRIDNSRFFASVEDVPLHCITQGIGTILEARQLVLLAFGPEKAEAVAAAVEGPLTSRVPGSAIQLHPRVTVVVDEFAASWLEYADYYRHCWQNKLYRCPDRRDAP